MIKPLLITIAAMMLLVVGSLLAGSFLVGDFQWITWAAVRIISFVWGIVVLLSILGDTWH